MSLSIVAGGAKSKIKAMALGSLSVPFGCPFSRREIDPPTGSTVFLFKPANSSARVFTQIVW